MTAERSGALDAIGEENVFPATARVLASENMAWEAAQKWLMQQPAADQDVIPDQEKEEP